jgi:nucleoside 2-deoxyribosyltransferase
MPLATGVKLCDKGSSNRRPAMKFYTAGKVWHAPKFRDLRDSYGFPIQARWIDLEADSDIVMNRKDVLWTQCLEDVRSSSYVLLYSEEFEEEQRGALVELGMAFAFNKPVYAVGTCKSLKANGISDVAFTHYPLFKWLNATDLLTGAVEATMLETQRRKAAA